MATDTKVQNHKCANSRFVSCFTRDCAIEDTKLGLTLVPDCTDQMLAPGWILTPMLFSWKAVGTPRNARTQSNTRGFMWEYHSCTSPSWLVVLKASLTVFMVFMVGPSTHVLPGWETDFAVFPHLLQTQLEMDSHPELQVNCPSLGRNTHSGQEELVRSGCYLSRNRP